jgi:putative ABC transport system ATP-binding protein
VKLVADRVTIAYGKDRPVVRDVSLSVSSGRILAVTGASGAGKTTLLSALAGLLRPVAGEVTLDGLAVRGRDHAVEQRVVLIPQNNGLAPILTAFENVHVALLSAGAPVNEARRLSTEALATLGLEGQAEQLVEELSGGQQQRAAIARGLALRGNVIIADEITSELDAANRQNVLRLLRVEADRGAVVVLATHDPQAAAVCDDELHLVDGFTVISGTAR